MKHWHWVTALAVLVATGCTFAILVRNVDDPLGANFPSVVQATFTVTLVVITGSYVIATWALAQSTKKQVDASIAAPRVEAASLVLKDYVKKCRETPQQLDIVAAAIESASHKDGPRLFDPVRNAYRRSADTLGSFSASIDHNHASLPLHLRNAADELAVVRDRYRNETNHIIGFISHYLSKRASNAERWNEPVVAARWDIDERPSTPGTPSWEDALPGPVALEVKAKLEAFRAALVEYVESDPK